MVYVNGGTLRSENHAGITLIPRAATLSAITRIAVDDVNVTIQEKNGELSDYAQALFVVTVDGAQTFGFSSILALNNFVAGFTTDPVTLNIKMLDDAFEDTNALTFANALTTVVFDGNGHGLRTSSINGIDVTDGNVTIKNIRFDGDHSGVVGIAAGGGKVYIGPNVTVGHYDVGLDVYNDGTEVTVNGLTIEAHNPVGFVVEDDTKTTVVMCKVDSRTPVDSTQSNPVCLGTAPLSGSFRIDGGWFAYKEDVANPLVSGEKVAAFVDPDYSYVKYVEKDKYYEVLYNDTPNVEIDTTITKRYGNEKQSDGTNIPYIVYDKSDPNPIVFKEVMPALVQIDAVGIITDQDGKVIETGKVYPIFTAEAGKPARSEFLTELFLRIVQVVDMICALNSGMAM